MTRILALALYLVLAVSPSFAQAPVPKSAGQMLYLPIYSHIWHGDVEGQKQPLKTLVSVLVSIRNTDPSRPVQLVSARYYDTDGKSIKEYVSSPRTIQAMGTYELFVPRSDDTGGSGANFVIIWKSAVPVNAPLVEAVHASLVSGRSIAFTTRAREISD